MAAGATIKHKRKSGSFTGGQLAAGELGLDTFFNRWYWSKDGTTVNYLDEFFALIADVATVLDDLVDVVIVDPAEGEYLRHNGSNWENRQILPADLPPEIDVVKLAGGLVDNTTFEYLIGVESSIQTQLDNQVPLDYLDTDITLAANSDAKVATQKAIKAYVDAMASGLDPKASVRVATTANITLSGTQTIDGVSVIVGNRVLVKNQSTASQNGIYVCASGAWSRATDADASAEVTSGLYCYVSEGTTNASSGWVLSTADPITLGSTSLTFTQFSGAGQITDGNALSKTGNVLDVNVDGSTIEVSSDALRVKDGGITLAKMASMATASLIGRNTAGTGVPEVLSAATVKTLLALVKGDVGLGNVDNTSNATERAATATLENKHIKKRVVTVTQSATPAINTDNTDIASITGLAQAITSMTSGLTGTPSAGDMLMIEYTDNGTARAITHGASFEASGTVPLPTTTVAGVLLTVLYKWNTVTSKWRCIAVA